MGKKIIYVDSFSIGVFHEMFNASSLKMFSEIFDKVEYYTSNEIFSNTKNILKVIPSNVDFKYLPIVNLNNRIGHFLRQFVPILTNSYILLKASKNDIVFFNYNALWSLSLVNFLSKVLQRQVIIMIHGELELFTNNVKVNYFSKRALNRFNSEKFNPAKQLYFCVLGKSIKDNLFDIVTSKVYKKIIFFEHSYVFRAEVPKKTKKDSVIRIGTIGTVRKEKGVDTLLKVGYSLKTIKNIKLYALGRVHFDCKVLENAGINIVSESDKRFLTRIELDNAISEMDYILFLIPTDAYKFTASGALYDAIDNEKPILALRNNYFNYVFNFRQNVGKLFADENELIDFISNIKNTNNLLDFKKIKKHLSTIEVGKTFAKQLIEIKFIE